MLAFMVVKSSSDRWPSILDLMVRRFSARCSSSPGDTQDRSAPTPTKRLFVGQQLRRLHSRFAESAQPHNDPNLEKSSSSSLLLLAAPPIRYSAQRHPDQTDLTNQFFTGIAEVQRPRFFRAYDTKAERPHLNAPLLLALA
jgi:hypothetical protein